MKRILLFFVIFFLFPVSVLAADLEVTCTSDSCTPTTAPAIFTSSEIWYPGMTLTKSIRVVNNSSDTLSFYNQAQNHSATGSLDEVFDFAIDVYGGANLFSDKIAQFYSTSSHPLVSLGANSSALLLYTATMPAYLGNDYQNKNTIFDLVLNFSGGHSDNPPGDNPPGPNPAPPVCTQTPPSSAPGNLHIISQSTNSVTFGWNAVSPLSHYALIFTRLRDGAKYGSTNIGSGTRYTISGLSGGERYEFEIFGVNGCAPGPASKITQRITGGFIAGRPNGQGGEVLGDTTASASGEIIEPLPLSPTPSVLSLDTSTCQQPWWRMLFIIVTIVLPIPLQVVKRKKYFRSKGLLSLVVFVTAFIVDRMFFCTHPIWPALILLSHLFASYIFQKRRSMP